MNRRVPPLVIGTLLLPLGWGCSDDPTGPVVSFCSDQPALAIATFEDAGLETAIRSALMVGPTEDLTCALISELTVLDASSAEITSLAGAQELTGLVTLNLFNNSIRDIRPLGGLRAIGSLNISFNSDLSDIQPLLDNSGIGAGDQVFLGFTAVSCSDVAALAAKGATVTGIAPC